MNTVFTTPGEMDVRSFTIFGMSAKPASENPIGFFGTGLKYAVAVLSRMGVPMTVWIGTKQHVFYANEVGFRGKTFSAIRMKRASGLTSRWAYEALPFTTELGKTWETWQVLRELYANTLDEGGSLSYEDGEVVGERGVTKVVVGGDEFAKEASKLDAIFLPDGRSGGFGAEAIRRDKPVEHLFWRRMRVLDLQKPSIFAWNILSSVELTEDRTLKNSFVGTYHVVDHVLKSTDEAFLKTVLSADDDTFEGSLDYDSWSHLTPSQEFIKIASRYGKRRVTSFLVGHMPREAIKDVPWNKILAEKLRAGAWDDVLAIVQENRFRLAGILDRYEESSSSSSDDMPF